jgi:hypothetical protein
MCLHPAFGSKICLQGIIRTIRKEPAGEKGTAKKTMNGNKQIVGKYTTLARILADGDISID